METLDIAMCGIVLTIWYLECPANFLLHGKEEQLSKDIREIGGQAVWSVTSAKPGNGVELLRDGKIDTYWQ